MNKNYYSIAHLQVRFTPERLRHMSVLQKITKCAYCNVLSSHYFSTHHARPHNLE